jgi:hypothetical protein
MGRRNIDLALPQLQILLNQVWDEQEVVVDYPIYDLTLFRYDLHTGRVTASLGRRGFQRETPSGLLQAVEDAHQGADAGGSGSSWDPLDDLPTWSMYHQALLSSRALTYANEDDIAETIRTHVQHASQYTGRFTLGFDTNVLYNAVPRRALPDWLPEAGEPGYVLASYVEDELDNHYYTTDGEENTLSSRNREAILDKLIPPRDTGQQFFEDATRQQDIEYALRQLRLRRRARQARIGKAEVQALTDDRGAQTHQPDEETIPDDIRVPSDPAIAQAYQQYQDRNQDAHVAILTSDSNMEAKLEDHDVEALYLKLPANPTQGLPDGPLDERTLLQLLHDLSLLFGVLRVRAGEHDVQIVADYGGKGAVEGYRDEEVRVRVAEEDEGLSERMEKAKGAVGAIDPAYR